MKIDREMVIRAGLKLLDEVGLEQLTLRRLASELNVKAPTLYWHFKGKGELVDAMATTVLAEAGSGLMPTSKSVPWKKWAVAYGNGLRKVLLSHRDGARMVAGTRLTNTAYMEVMETVGAVFIDSGFSLRETVVLLSTIYSFTVSFVMEEQAVYPWPGRRSPLYDLTARNKQLDPKKFPLLRRSGEILLDGFGRRYRESLWLILLGASVGR